jgi:hypothetical protein
VHIDRKGYSLLHIDKYNEDYLITMPKIHIEGLMTGSLCPELSGTSYIHSSSGFTIKIDYSSKGWLHGKKNGFHATIFRDGHEKDPLYTVEGQWSDQWTVHQGKHKGEAIETFNMSSVKRTPLTVSPVEEQHPLESRKAWRKVTDAIHKGDIFAVGSEKGKIENEQRQMRKREDGEGTDWERRYFSPCEGDQTADKLAEGIEGLRAEMDGQEGSWAWDESKYKSIHGGIEEVRTPRRERFDSGVMMELDPEKFAS